MNTQQGSSTGLNTVNYVIFLNISDSAVSACEELPGSQKQSDRSSPASIRRDGESLLKMRVTNPQAQGRSLRGSAAAPEGLRQFWGAPAGTQGNVYPQPHQSLRDQYTFHSLAQQALVLRSDRRLSASRLCLRFSTCFVLSVSSPSPLHRAPNISLEGTFLHTIAIQFPVFLCGLVSGEYRAVGEESSAAD